jgi:transcriptional regulator with XRE-family HTH domain
MNLTRLSMKDYQRVKNATVLGEMIFKARTNMGLTLKQAANKSRVPYSTFVDLELGIRKKPAAITIARISRGLKLKSLKVFKAVLMDAKQL